MSYSKDIKYSILHCSRQGPRKWVRKMAIPRYASYPVSRGINTESWSSTLGVGREANNLTFKKEIWLIYRAVAPLMI
jgi:hypothetical protein